jgi:hypothetical protein
LLLIAAGFGLGAAAVFLLYPRRPADETEAKGIESPPTPELEVAPLAVHSVEEPPADFAVEPPTIPPSPPTIASSLPHPTADSNGEPRMTEQAPPSPPTPEQRLFPVVTLLRDEVTGQLVLQVGPRTYQDPQALRVSPDWTRVEFAARDLARWMEGSAPPPPRTEEHRPEDPPMAGSMVEQISRILETKLAAQGESGRGVRLVEGPGGAVRVYVGVQPYGLDEVPDPAIRTAIREAVAEWEASR